MSMHGTVNFKYSQMEILIAEYETLTVIAPKVVYLKIIMTSPGLAVGSN